MCSVYNKVTKNEKSWNIIEINYWYLQKEESLMGVFEKKFVANLKHIFVVEEFSFHQITFI